MLKFALSLLCMLVPLAQAQVAPAPAEVAAYTGLFAAAARGDAAEIAKLAAAGAAVNARDAYGRTPLHVAAYARRHDAMRALAKAGADPNALERDRYDIVTIAAVADDVGTLDVALAIGCKATNVTSRYDGTALIAAAHLGHDEVVQRLIKADAPLDHVNNLGWTALIESIVLGNGGPRRADIEGARRCRREREPARPQRDDAAAPRAGQRLSHDPNALERDRYDIVTIAAVADDVGTLDVALAIGGKATNVTSRYDGTALIAAAHLGHDEVVQRLIKAGAPLDHVNNLGWTALIESIVLGNGGPRHVLTLKALVDAGANVNLPDRNGMTPLHLAQANGYRTMATILEEAGAR